MTARRLAPAVVAAESDRRIESAPDVWPHPNVSQSLSTQSYRRGGTFFHVAADGGRVGHVEAQTVQVVPRGEDTPHEVLQIIGLHGFRGFWRTSDQQRGSDESPTGWWLHREQLRGRTSLGIQHFVVLVYVDDVLGARRIARCTGVALPRGRPCLVSGLTSFCARLATSQRIPASDR